jgi:integrase
VAKRRAGRRARGTGSVFWNAARQVWVARKTIGGVRVERWGRTQREAVDRLAAALPPDPASVTVSQWADRWRETLTVRRSTRHSYGVSIDKHVLPVLGDVRLADLTAGDVERFTAQLLEGVAVTTARLIVAHLRVLLQAAVRAGLLVSNPAGAARKPRHDPGPVATYTPAELQTIVGAAARYAAGGVIATLAATGMRVGEALALDVTDWDAAAGTLRIDRTYSRRFGVGPPKSRHSRRVITAPDLVRSVLDAARGGRSMGPLFPSSAGRRRSGRAVTRAWASLLRSAGLPRRKLHTLRHSVATAMIGAGVPLPDVAAYLGDTVATLAKTYLHRTRTDPVCAVNGYLRP